MVQSQTFHDASVYPVMQKRALLIVLLAAALPVMMATVLSPALPAIQSEFRGEPDIEVLAKLVLTTPALAIALSAGMIGFLIDRWGRFPILSAALLLFGVAGMHGLWATDIHSMIAARFVFGLGVAGIMTSTGTWLADHFEGRMLRRMVGLQAGLMGLWGIAFQIMAGYLAEYSWRYPFLLFGSALLILLLLVSESSLRDEVGARRRPVPAPGQGTFRSSRKLILSLALLSASAMSLFSLVPVQGPLFFLNAFSLTPRETALLISSLTASSSSASFLLAFWRPHLSFRLAIGLGLASISAGFSLMVLAEVWGLLLFSMIGIGAGVGIVVPCIHAIIASRTPSRLRGRVLGGLLSSNYVGQFLSPLWAHLILAQTGDRQLFAVTAGIATVLSAVVFISPLFDMEGQKTAH